MSRLVIESGYETRSAQAAAIDAEIKAGIDDMLDGLAAGSVQGEELLRQTGHLLENYPLFRFLEHIKGRGHEVFPQFEAAICAASQSALQEYAHTKLPSDKSNLEDFLTPVGCFYLGLLYAKDRLTALHCIDTFALAQYTLAAGLDVTGEFDAVQKKLLPQTALDHDIGKANVPGVLLGSPVRHSQHGAVWAGNLADPRRKRAISADIRLDQWERATFLPLIEGRRHNPQLVEEFVKIFAERGGDHREVPIRYALAVASHILENNGFPDEIARRLDPRDRTIDEPMMNILVKQRQALSRVDGIFDLFGLDGWQINFIAALGLHESSSEKIVLAEADGLPEEQAKLKQRGALIVGNHHAYDSAGKLDKVPEGDHALVNLLRIIDIVAALGQIGRPYKGGYRITRCKGDSRRRS